MQLSKRLQAVADLVTPGSRVADVGCDHAYTSIYLVENMISPFVIAMDVNQGPIERAKENIIKHGCGERIETRKSNGLEKLDLGEVNTILIGGMGGPLTVQILSEKLEVMKAANELILQPQSEIHKVRQFLQEQNFIIIDENMVKEDGKYYVMMKALTKSDVDDDLAYKLIQKEHFYYGKLLLIHQNPMLKEFLLWDLSLCEGIQNTLKDGHTDNSKVRSKEIQERMELIQLGLSYYIEDEIV